MPNPHKDLDDSAKVALFWLARCEAQKCLPRDFVRITNARALFMKRGRVLEAWQLLEDAEFHRACFEALKSTMAGVYDPSENASAIFVQIHRFPHRCFHGRGAAALTEIRNFALAWMKEQVR